MPVLIVVLSAIFTILTVLAWLALKLATDIIVAFATFL